MTTELGAIHMKRRAFTFRGFESRCREGNMRRMSTTALPDFL